MPCAVRQNYRKSKLCKINIYATTYKTCLVKSKDISILNKEKYTIIFSCPFAYSIYPWIEKHLYDLNSPQAQGKSQHKTKVGKGFLKKEITI